MSRQIACFEIPSFEIALARLREPGLRSRPVAVAPRAPRACLSEVSSEAAEEGLAPGLLVEDARVLCPSVRLLAPDPACRETADRALRDVVASFTPLWEPLQPGQVFVDLTGTSRLFGRAPDTVQRIEREANRRIGLNGVVGLATNKLVARVASTLVPPLEVYAVRPGHERLFMAPLPIGLLSVRLQTPEVLTALEDFNLRTMGEVATAPLPSLALILGRWAAPLQEWARGIDPTPVRPPVERPRLEESVSLSPDDVDDERLLGQAFDLVERLCRTLRVQGRACRQITLTLRHSDDRIAARTVPITPATQWEAELCPVLQRLFYTVFVRRVRLRAMTVAVGHVHAMAEQLSLFPDESDAGRSREQARRLTVAMDRIRSRHGEQAIRFGRSGSLKEAWRF